MLKRIAMAGLAVVWLMSVSVRAHETDQFSVPDGRPMADLRHYFSSRVYGVLSRAAERTNSRIRASFSDGQPTEQTKRLQSPDSLAWNVLFEFPPVINYIERMELTLRSPEIRGRYPGMLTLYQPVFWVYSHWLLVLDPTKLVRLARCSTVMIDGVYLGTDKIAHFVHMGYLYYSEYRRARAEGVDEEGAVRRGVALGSGGNLFLSESALLGMLATGVRSNGDLAANYAGMKFFRNLTEPVRLNGKETPPLLVLDDELWRLNDHVNPYGDFFTVFVSDHWNEALNPNIFGPGIAGCVRQEVRKRCEGLLNWYTDARGRRRSQEDFEDIRQELSTYFGEDYGHQSDPTSTVTIAQCCFDPPTDSDAPPEPMGYGGSAGLAASLEFPQSRPASEKDWPTLDAWGRSPLWWAAAEGRTADVEALLQQGLSVQRADRDGETPLHAAARRGHAGIVKLLLGATADPNAPGPYGATPLHFACRGLFLDAGRELLRRGADVRRQDDFGCTALHDAASRGDGRWVELLLSHGSNPSAKDLGGTTPLHRAARIGSMEVAMRLLAAGANPLEKNDAGLSAWDEAREGRYDSLAALFSPVGSVVGNLGGN